MTTHMAYVAAAYGASALVLGILALGLILQRRSAKLQLAALEAAGVKRRSDR
jgi:heme exporter protein D